MSDETPPAIECPLCEGYGYMDGEYDQMDAECPSCHGDGYVYSPDAREEGEYDWELR